MKDWASQKLQASINIAAFGYCAATMRSAGQN